MILNNCLYKKHIYNETNMLITELVSISNNKEAPPK